MKSKIIFLATIFLLTNAYAAVNYVEINNNISTAAHSIDSNKGSSNRTSIKASLLKSLTEIQSKDAYHVLFSLRAPLTCNEFDLIKINYDKYVDYMKNSENWDSNTSKLKDYDYEFKFLLAGVSTSDIKYSFAHLVRFPAPYADQCEFNVDFKIDRITGLAKDINSTLYDCGGREIPYDIDSALETASHPKEFCTN